MKNNNEIYLTNTLNDFLTRQSFRITIILLLSDKQISFTNFFINCECIEIYIVINKIIVFEIYKRL